MWWPTEKADKVSRVDFATEFRDKHFESMQLSAAVLLPRQSRHPIAGFCPTTTTADFALGKTVS
jgi:hypothetical protein